MTWLPPAPARDPASLTPVLRWLLHTRTIQDCGESLGIATRHAVALGHTRDEISAAMRRGEGGDA